MSLRLLQGSSSGCTLSAGLLQVWILPDCVTPETVLVNAVASGLMLGLSCTGSNIRSPGIYVAFYQGKQKYVETSFSTLGPITGYLQWDQDSVN